MSDRILDILNLLSSSNKHEAASAMKRLQEMSRKEYLGDAVRSQLKGDQSENGKTIIQKRLDSLTEALALRDQEISQLSKDLQLAVDERKVEQENFQGTLRELEEKAVHLFKTQSNLQKLAAEKEELALAISEIFQAHTEVFECMAEDVDEMDDVDTIRESCIKNGCAVMLDALHEFKKKHRLSLKPNRNKTVLGVKYVTQRDRRLAHEFVFFKDIPPSGPILALPEPKEILNEYP